MGCRCRGAKDAVPGGAEQLLSMVVRIMQLQAAYVAERSDTWVTGTRVLGHN